MNHCFVKMVTFTLHAKRLHLLNRINQAYKISMLDINPMGQNMRAIKLDECA